MKFYLAFLIFVFNSVCCYSQLCPGSLGDAIINETFGQGRAGQAALSTSMISYTKTGGCPNKGEYTINNFIYGCGAGTWQQTVGDHTHDIDGNYLMVNAESTPGNVYVRTVDEVCPNTTYQFAVWVMNVLKTDACNKNPVHPNLILKVLTVNGQLLAQTSTGDILETDLKTWYQFGTCFTTPPGVTSVVLSITTDPKPGCGSAFMIDDLTLKASGPKVTIILDKDSTDKDVCSGYSNPFLFQGKYSSGFNDPVVQWQSSLDSGKTWLDIAGATSLSFNMPKRNSGNIKYRLVVAERGNINSAHCKIASIPIGVNVHDLPNQQSTVNKTGCSGTSYQLLDTSFSSTYNLKYSWKGPGGFQSNLPAPIIPNLNYSDSGRYYVTLTTDFGCSQTDTLNLSVVTGSQIEVSPANSNICSGEKVSFNSTGEGSFQWSPTIYLSAANIPNPMSTPLDSVNYTVTLTNPSGCKSFAQASIHVITSPFANAGADKTILKGDSITLNGVATGSGISYLWTPSSYLSDPNSLTPIAFPPTDISYTLNAVSNLGCGFATSTVKIKVLNDVFIPNAFSPNNDSRNDKFHIIAPSDFTISRFQIFNRNGFCVYNGGKGEVSWDGTFNGQLQPEGIYIYILQMEGPANKKIFRKGSFLLLR